MSIFYSLHRICPVQLGQTLAESTWICTLLVMFTASHSVHVPPSLSCPVVEGTQWFMYCSI